MTIHFTFHQDVSLVQCACSLPVPCPLCVPQDSPCGFTVLCSAHRLGCHCNGFGFSLAYGPITLTAEDSLDDEA